MKDPLTETTALLRGLEPDAPATWPARCLVMIAGPDLGRRIELRPGELTIGRESHCDVVVPLGGISRVHCSERSSSCSTPRARSRCTTSRCTAPWRSTASPRCATAARSRRCSGPRSRAAAVISIGSACC